MIQVNEFQEVESNHSESLSYVPSQPAAIPSCRSMLSCDKRLAETWNPPGLQENVFANPRWTHESLQIPYRGIHPLMTPSAAGGAPALISTRKPVAREEDERKVSTIPMPTFARRPPTVSSLTPVDIPQSSMAGQQRQQISELQFDKFPAPSSFVCWKIRFGSQMTACPGFPSEAMLWTKVVEMVDSMKELKSSRSFAGENLPIFDMLDAKIFMMTTFRNSIRDETKFYCQ